MYALYLHDALSRFSIGRIPKLISNQRSYFLLLFFLLSSLEIPFNVGTIVVEKAKKGICLSASNLNEKKKKKKKGYVRYSRKKLLPHSLFYLVVTRRDPATMHLETHVADFIEIFRVLCVIVSLDISKSSLPINKVVRLVSFQATILNVDSFKSNIVRRLKEEEHETRATYIHRVIAQLIRLATENQNTQPYYGWFSAARYDARMCISIVSYLVFFRSAAYSFLNETLADSLKIFVRR